MINRLSNPINRNRSAAKFSKVMSSNIQPSWDMRWSVPRWGNMRKCAKLRTVEVGQYTDLGSGRWERDKRAKELKRTNWHKATDNQVSAPLILDPTSGDMSKEMREVARKFEVVTGWRVPVVERAGLRVGSIAKAEPSGGSKGPRQSWWTAKLSSTSILWSGLCQQEVFRTSPGSWQVAEEDEDNRSMSLEQPNFLYLDFHFLFWLLVILTLGINCGLKTGREGTETVANILTIKYSTSIFIPNEAGTIAHLWVWLGPGSP